MKRTFIRILTMTLLMAAAGAARAQDTNNTNNATGTDRSSFDIIFKRNIFDPTRSGYHPRPVTHTPRIDSFTLVGTMSYSNVNYAFFDSSSSSYRKTLKPSEKIAGYKIAAIAQDHVLLAAASNTTINLPVGTRMRREDNGPWMRTSREDPDATPAPSADSTAQSSSSSTNTSSPATPALTGGESDAMKRLMLKRMQEK